MILIDKLSYSSKLRYANPSLKALFSIATLLVCVACRSIIISIIVLLIMGCAAVFFSGTSPFYYMKLLVIPIAFLILGTIAIIINYTDNTQNALLIIPFMSKYLIISRASFLFAIQLILTSLSAVSCLYFLALTTPMTDILMVLKKIHCPYIFIELMLLIYRFIFLLLDLSYSLSVSQKSRLGNRDFKASCNSSGKLMAILLVRAFQKSSYLYDAMESRCYDGQIRVLEENYKLKTNYLFLVIFFELVLILLAVFMRIYHINI